MELTSTEIRQITKSRLGGKSIAEILLAQALYEAKVVLKDRLAFRTRENERATRAYCQMKTQDFEIVNSRQQWANWRTIPKNLIACGFTSPLRALDLCCGVGHSTEVIASFLPLGSSVLGLEFNPEFVRRAKQRSYYHHSGRKVDVDFRAQSVLEQFVDPSGNPIPDNSIGLVNSSGAVGCHFTASSTEILAQEVKRVLQPGGFALIDAGKAGTPRGELVHIFQSLGMAYQGEEKSCFLDRYTNVRFLKR